MKRITLLILTVLILSSCSVSASSGCSLTAFKEACSQCTQDAQGNMDKTCKDAKTSGGKACLMAAYPYAAIAYQDGNCPEVDECIKEFNVCDAMTCIGNDAEDCANPVCQECYTRGDTCLENAAKACSEQGRDEVEALCPCVGIYPLTLAMLSLAAIIGTPVIFKRKF